MRSNQALVALLSLGLGVRATYKPKVTSEKLQAEIRTENLWANLEALHEIAAANGGNRAFGLPGYAASVDYIWGRISDIPGTKAWKQDFPGLFNLVESIELRVDGKPFYVYGLTYSPSTSKEGITAELVLGPEGAAGCDASSYEGLDVAGKIVLVERFRCPTGGTLAGRLLPAAANGAAAVLIYNNIPTNATAGSLSQPNPEKYVPGGFINQADGLAIKERLEAGEKLEAYFQQTQVIEERITQNVFVETEDGDPDNVIVLGAHLDSVQAGPGINDDGSGTSLILEVFHALTKYKTKNKVRFAWWAAEENGLVGSKYYCSTLTAAEANKILAYLNFDMVSKGYFGVGDGDGSSHGSVAPPGSEVIEQIYVDYFSSRGIEVTPAIITNGSDYASFWQILNKRSDCVEQDPCYHQLCDTIENPNPETITINAQAAAHMVATLAMKGTELIPKAPVNATMFNHVKSRSLMWDHIAIEELEALGERHLGCGHEI
ncbi:hypothetical protein DL765_007583 [Monosporascus sp. GIB2]|nr:hypothetical protein DL765_007583 [Monosporascus sp. GIB2]